MKNNKIIVPKRKGEDGYTAKTELSRNEVIITLLTQALDIAEIKEDEEQ